MIAMVAAQFRAREALRDPPFALYGLPDLGPREVATFSYDGRTLSLAGLGHGLREDPDRPWVEIVVAGPLHGVFDGPHGSGTWEEHPETLALFHIVISNNPSIDGEQVASAEAALAEHWASAELTVDGEPQTFKLVRRGPHWGAIRHIEPDHAIVISASNIAPEEVHLEHIQDLEPYFDNA
jgi:hypothetical protein